MFVAGIDPGLSRCGYAVLDASGPSVRVAAIGAIRTSPDQSVPLRLGLLQREIRAVFEAHPPRACAVERLYFQVNVATAISVAQASGVVIAEAVAAGAQVSDYTPNQVKEAVAGYGSAPKDQVGEMVRRLLGLDTVPTPADAADAAAVALCHLAMAPVQEPLRRAAARHPAGANPPARPPSRGLRAVNSGGGP